MKPKQSQVTVTLILIVWISSTIGLSIENNKSEGNFESVGSSFIPEANPSEQAQEQFRATSYYSGHGQPQRFVHSDRNRDAYTSPASDLSYSGDASQSYSSSYHPVPSTSYGTSYGVDEGHDSDGFGSGGFLGGLGGLAGLLGIKGLKGLGIFGLLKLGLIPLFFLLLPAVLLLPLLLLFIPIPVITLPQPGRSFGFDVKELGGKMSNLARNVMESEQCIERMSCEMSRYGRGTYFDTTLKKVVEKFEQQLPAALLRMARAYLDSGATGCKKFGCFLIDDSGANVRSKKFKKKTL